MKWRSARCILTDSSEASDVDKGQNLDNLTIASPDMGGSKRAYAYSKALGSDVVICYKQREKANIISHMELIGDVKGKNVVLVDDMVDTAGTLTKAADLMIAVAHTHLTLPTKMRE